MATLDRWLKAEEYPSREIIHYKNASVFINIPDLHKYYKMELRTIDFAKLHKYFNYNYSSLKGISLYLGGLNKDYKDTKLYQQQQEFHEKLKVIGYNLNIVDKYWKSGLNKPIAKGIDVSLAIDTIHKSHPKINDLDTIILVCGEYNKFLRTKQIIKNEYNKKCVLFSLEEMFDLEQDKFFEFLQQTSQKITQQESSVPLESELYNIKGESSDIRRMTYAPTKSDKLRLRAQKLRQQPQDKLKTMAFIDYYNLKINLKNLNKLNPHRPHISEVEFFTRILSHIKSRNNMVNIPKIYTGFPLFETKSLDKIKSKQLTLKRELEAIGYKMILSSNEALIQGGMKEKDVDINIAVDIIHSCLEHSLEKIILCTGDADFIPVIKLLNHLKISVELLTFENTSLSPLFRKENCNISSINRVVRY